MIELKLTIEEVNQILAALGTQPYQDVYALVNNIQQQAQSQLQNDSDGPNQAERASKK
jgi:hypothetical protein